MATTYKPPTPLASVWSKDRFKVFLAGSIEMGEAEDWQKSLEDKLSDLNIDLYNPRRDDWDPSWEQMIDNAPFKEQVDWELDALEMVDLIVMYLSPGTVSPISLLELGLYASGGRLVVCCPDGFHRKGNVDIVCHRYGIKKVNSLDDVVSFMKVKVENFIRSGRPTVYPFPLVI